MKSKRLIIYVSDIVLLTGKSKRQCYRIMAKVKKDYNKQPHHYVTIREYCVYSGMNEDEVREKLND